MKRVVHQKSWQLIEVVAQHAHSDSAAGIFADFLDGSRDLHELNFYLYAWTLLCTAVPEESQVSVTPAKPPTGCVSLSRAYRLADLLFADLPKSLGVVRRELEKFTRSSEWEVSISDFLHHRSTGSMLEPLGVGSGVLVDDLMMALLEGWRVSVLLLDRNVPNFSWRVCLLDFVRSDPRGRGWLDAHSVREAESRSELRGSGVGGSAPIPERTSLGAFVFRAVNRCGSTGEEVEKQEALVPVVAGPLAKTARAARRREQEACLKVSQAAFTSLEKAMSVYLAWLVHSDDPRDLSVYHAVKARIFAFRSASGAKSAWPCTHNLRCLLLLLLSHQFDLQHQRKEVAADHLAWEFTAMLRVLRESWRRGSAQPAEVAGKDQGSGDEEVCGPGFGAELDEVGEAIL